MLLFDLRWVLFGLLTLLSTVVSVTVYVTRWQLARRQTATLLRRLRPLFADAPLGILILTGAQSYSYANPQARRLFHLPGETGKLPTAVWVLDLQADLQQLAQAPQGRYRTIRLTPTLQEQNEQESGQTVRWWAIAWAGVNLLFVVDLTQQQRTAQQTRFLLSDLSHELRTPLATLQTHIAVLRLPTLAEEIRNQSLHILQEETQRLVRTATSAAKATKLCAVFADPARDWHGRTGWVIDLTYAQLADSEEDTYWNVAELAWRVHEATAKGLRVLVRVDYAKGQTLPPANDALALHEYLAYLRRLARDERLKPVYGFIIGSGPNAHNSNTLAPTQPITPAWYARLFNGYGEPADHTDNAVQTLHEENPYARVLVGPVRPWIGDQDGALAYTIAMPWLNYMNTLVALLDESAQAKMRAGHPLAGADGFALHAPGRPDAPELAGRAAAEEPRFALPRSTWHKAQAGFQIYQEWLAIINAYPTTRGLPVYISATNTTPPDAGLPPAQNYPAGWLTNALATVNAEPQVQALCWFMDLVPGDDRWDAFSLTRQPGRMVYAAEEFDELLRR